MERYIDHQPIDDNLWTYDVIADQNVIGSIREPLRITTESGLVLAPATIDYIKDEQGDRVSPFISGSFVKQTYDYGKASFYGDFQVVRDYLVHDEKAGISIIALPLQPETRLFRGIANFNRFLDLNIPESQIARRVVDFFPQYRFGIFGSRATLMVDANSDIDMYIYGGEDFIEVTSLLREKDVQQYLGLVPLPEEEQQKYAQVYARRFRIDHEKALKIAHLRSRYLAEKGSGRQVKIAFSGCFDHQEYSMQTLLGSTKIKKIAEEGFVIDVRNSASFPREYMVEIAGQPTRILTMQWVLQRMVEVGERVHIKGFLRENKGKMFISLEDHDDIIITG